MSELKRYKVVEVDYEGFHFEMDDRWQFACGPQHGSYVYSASEIDPLLKAHSRLREKVARLCDLNKRVGDRCRLDHGWSAQDVTDHREELSERDALFAELDAQEKGNG